MGTKEIKKLFDKYVRHECSVDEIALLEKFLESYQKKDARSDKTLSDILDKSQEQVWLRLQSEIQERDKRNYIFPLMKYAAALIVLLASSVYFFYENLEVDIDEQLLQIKESTVVLKTDEYAKKLNILGKQPIKNGEGEIIASQSGTRLIYATPEKSSELIFNEILVPYGKKFQLQLSDGTVVHLNSGSSLRFPISFIEGEDREVFLAGEAYFEVTKNEHQPFYVNAGEMKIAVLGTRFVVNSHEGNDNYTVLMEGSVSLSSKNENHETQKINPGEKATFSKNIIELTQVNVNDYLGWINGQLIFNHQPFPDVIKKIERKYNVSITNRHTSLNDLKFRGKFDDESILDLMDVFKKTAGFEYKIEANKIIIIAPKAE